MDIKDLNSYLLALQNLASGLNLNKNGLNTGDDFEKYMSEINASYDISKVTKSMDVEQFRQNLTSLGASNFVHQLNLQKIEEKLAAKKEELKKALGLDDESIAGKNKSEILELNAVLDELLNQFKKELLAGMQNNSLLEKQQKLSSASLSPTASLLGIL